MSIQAGDVEPRLVELGCIYVPDNPGTLPYHFIGVSGAHLGGYVNIDPAFPHVRFLKSLAGLLVEPHIVRPDKPEQRRIGAVATPAIGSIPLSVVCAEVIMEAEGRDENDEVVAVWADKIEHEGQPVDFAFTRPGFVEALLGVIAREEDILVVEDYINKKHSALRVVDAVRKVAGPNAVAGVATIAANRGVTAQGLAVPHYKQLCEVTYPTWTPDECRLTGPCANNIPIVVDKALGHGAEFRDKNPTYQGGFVELRAA
ncbi:MAG TPA: hypothetical protein VLF40_03330 [Candidatus Saccharimonadales bacterium]|nr:hypothetical protein [Candidatus Saccharimonadales bacterium]